MATIVYQPPIVQVNAPAGAISIISLKASSHCNEADFVKLSSGQIVPCVADDHANIVGIIQQDSSAVFGDTTSGNLQGVFGKSQIDTGLVSATPIERLVATLGPPVVVEMSLPATTGWVSGGTHQANIGTAIGLAIDSTTGYFYADDQASDAIGHIVGKVFGPFKGIAGDLAARVLVAVDVSGVLITPQGH